MITLCIASLTGVLVCLSVIFKPVIRIGHFNIGTYWIISLLGAIFLLIFHQLPIKYLWNRIIEPTPVNPIKILILFLGMTFLSIVLDELGFFQFLANLILKRKPKNQIGLFIKLYFLVSILTIFTSNDIIILTFTPFICCFAKKAKISPLPYLFGEFFAANTWSMCLLIGNPTNIYLATMAHFSFFTYVQYMIFPTILAGIVSLSILLFLFHKVLKEPIENVEFFSIQFHKPMLILSLIHLIVCILLLAISSYIEIEMFWIPLGFASSLFIICLVFSLLQKNGKLLKRSICRLPYELIPFLLAMFAIVLGLEYSGITEKIAEIFKKANPIFTMGITSFLSANIINNIPMSVMYGSILKTGIFTELEFIGGTYATIIGSNIGAYFTPVGALAGLMWLSILKIYDVQIRFKEFILYGAITAIPTLLVSLFGLWLVL